MQNRGVVLSCTQRPDVLGSEGDLDGYSESRPRQRRKAAASDRETIPYLESLFRPLSSRYRLAAEPLPLRCGVRDVQAEEGQHSRAGQLRSAGRTLSVHV